MAVDHIRYDLLTQDAMRGVLRTVLKDVAAKGLPGEHHFFISFDPRAAGVRLSPRLLAQYPEEMTIVLQHQYWDLVVGEDGFEVGLSFNGAPERLSVPFAAVKGFFDPSVKFGLQFAQISEAADKADKAGKSARKATTVSRPSAPSAPEAPRPARGALPAPPEADRPPGGGEVVKLDRFRKK